MITVKITGQSMNLVYDNDHPQTYREFTSDKNSNKHTSYKNSNEKKQHTDLNR